MELDGFKGRCQCCGDAVQVHELDRIKLSYGEAFVCFYCIEGFYYDGCKDKYQITAAIEKIMAKNHIPEIKDKARNTGKSVIDLEEILDFYWSLEYGSFWKSIAGNIN